MNVLVDTSVWVAHFKAANPALAACLLRDEVLVHPFVIGEIACGTPPAPRQRTLADLSLLAHVNAATATEVMTFIDRQALYGRGCGWVDISLLASILMTPGCRLWTRDKRLAGLADQFGVRFEG